MAPSIVHLPNGQTLSVSPVFGGVQFKANDLATHQNAFPPGWTITLHCEENPDDDNPEDTGADDAVIADHHHAARPSPSLRHDHLFISTISNPSSSDFRPPSSPTRQIAMMLWATLWWYFHQPAPSRTLLTPASAGTPPAGRPQGEWRVHINREGIFQGKHLLPKLERMGLIASEDSSVGADPDDGVRDAGAGWRHMFVSQRSFWQLDPRIYLFSLSPLPLNASYPSLSPNHSRPASPNRNTGGSGSIGVLGALPAALSRSATPPGPYQSASHLPTFYPPPPLQYTFTGGVRHPIRPKPPRQGETFYTRYVPSLGQYLSFRVASLSKRPVPHNGPTSTPDPTHNNNFLRGGGGMHSGDSTPSGVTFGGRPVPSSSSPSDDSQLNDTELLHKWMNDPRVAASWGESGPISHQEAFLTHALTSRHSFPVIGCFDGKPFGYFEVYWVKEDRLSAHLSGGGDWDRGLHVLVGEAEFRGPERVKVWLSALVHWCWLADLRTECVVMEPRVDNVKMRRYCEEAGFYKEKEVTLPHKQSNLMKIRREAWTAPAL
ncbi:hypothetical protein M433DRAFT_73895 [Acidomyces richmondensis BFW]|nr:MAG: hypothetical protein FE78DRAFT_137297 [Acidomyces sp. 'richmondensis']KYG42384.1 hypothetical protein M433DRAFT_73895 [Acidomyces richmondensis BFW]